MTIMHAFYSRRQEALISTEDDREGRDRYAGTIPIYRLKDGRIEACTELKDEPTGHNFADSVYLGEVEIPDSYLSSRKAENVI